MAFPLIAVEWLSLGLDSLEGKRSSGKAFFKGKFFYIYIPFLLAGVVYHRIMHGAWPHFQHHFENILLGNTGMHLYFIFMLCQYYIFAYLFRNVLTKKTVGFLMILFLGIQYLFISRYPAGLFDLDVRHYLLAWIFTIYLGHLLYWYREQLFDYLAKHRSVSFVLVGISVLSMIYFALSSTLYSANHLRFVLSSAIVLITALFFLNKIVDRVKIGFHKGLTFYIYLAHSIFILYTNKLVLNKLGFTWILEYKVISFLYLVGIYTLTFLFSLLLTWVIKKIVLLGKVEKEEHSVREVSRNF